jgi:hypothetical protein
MKKSALSILAIAAPGVGFLRGPQFCLPYDAVTQADACDVNTNGIKASGILFNSRKNITAYPAQATPTTSDDLGVLAGDYTVTSGKPFVALAHDHEVSDIKLEGTAPGVGPFKVTAKLFVRGSKAVIDGFASQAQYDEMVFVIPQADGVRRVVGNADYPAKVKAMFDSKTVGATDPRGWEFEISSYSTYSERLSTASAVPIV